jgi:hypothetical protein
MAFWMRIAHSTASTTLWNSQSAPSLHELDNAAAVLGDERFDHLLPVVLDAWKVPCSSRSIRRE